MTVSAAALSNVVRSRPSGKHYSSAGQFPLSPESMEWVVSTMAAVAVLSDMLPKGAFGSAK